MLFNNTIEEVHLSKVKVRFKEQETALAFCFCFRTLAKASGTSFNTESHNAQAINPFVPNAPFLRFSDVFRGQRKGDWERMG